MSGLLPNGNLFCHGLASMARRKWPIRPWPNWSGCASFWLLLKPKPINLEDTFDGQFDRAVRYPGLDEAMTQLSNIIEESASSAHELFAHMPGYAEYVTKASRLMEEHLGTSAGRQA